MNSEPEVVFEVDGRVATIRLNRPHVLNAVTASMGRTILDRVREVKEDDGIRVVIITGTGRAFSTGSDVKELSVLTVEQASHKVAAGAEMRNMLESLQKPVIAAINGAAVGGGFETALACDIRIAARSATMGFPQVNLGTIPGVGGMFRLVKLVGPGVAKALLFTGRLIDAEEALRLSLVDKVVDDERLLDEAKVLAHDLAGKSPTALWLLKSIVNKSYEMDSELGSLVSLLAVTQAAITEEYQAGIRAFLERKVRRQ